MTAALESYITLSKWAVRFIGAFIMGSIGYSIYLVIVKVVQP